MIANPSPLVSNRLRWSCHDSQLRYNLILLQWTALVASIPKAGAEAVRAWEVQFVGWVISLSKMGTYEEPVGVLRSDAAQPCKVRPDQFSSKPRY